MKDYFLKLFRYNQWANNLIIKALEQADSRTTEMVNLLAHINRAQEIWLSRILHTGNSQGGPELWPEEKFDEIKKQLQESSEEWAEFIETMNEDHFKEEHQYANSKGKLFTSSMEDVIIHVINHSTHHRAQISQLLREQGDNPPPTDYIFYSREEKE